MIQNFLHTALRTLFRQKSYALINVIGLTIGLASAVLIASTVYEDIRWDHYTENYDNIYRVVQIQQFGGVKAQHVSFNQTPLVPAMLRDLPEVEKGSRYRPLGSFSVTTNESDAPITLWSVMAVDSSFLEMFTYPLLAGDRHRLLRDPNEVVLSEKTALQLFGDESALGQELHLRDGRTLIVAGVTGTPSTKSHQNFTMLVPMSGFIDYYGEDPERWGGNSTTAYVQLVGGTSAAKIEEEFPEFITQYRTIDGITFYLQPLRDIHLRSGHIKYDHQYRRGNERDVYAYAGIGLLLLLIAGINFINLATARSMLRAKEVGIRKVSGASRGSLIRQFLVESLLLALISMLFAGVVAHLAVPAFSDLTGRVVDLRLTQFGFTTWALLGFTLLLGLAAGFYPALVLASFQPVTVLRGSRLSGIGGSWTRRNLVVFQFSAAVFLLIATAVIYLQLNYARTADIGYDRKQTFTVWISRSIDSGQRESVRDRVAAIPGVVSASLCSDNPVGSTSQSSFRFQGYQEDGWMASYYSMDEFGQETFGFQMVDGRWLSPDWGADARVDDQEVSALILNETAVKSLELEHPLGTLLRSTDFTGEVVGVVKDFHNLPLNLPVEPVLIFMGGPSWSWSLSVRIDANRTDEVLASMRELWAEAAPSFEFKYTFLDESFENLYTSEKTAQRQLMVFSTLSILVAMIGLLGLASFMMSRREREMGIRKVLGAGEGRIVLIATREFLLLVTVANLIAWPLAGWIMSRWLHGYVYATSLPWWLFPLAGAISLLAAVVTVSVQAWRVARINPIQVLRQE